MLLVHAVLGAPLLARVSGASGGDLRIVDVAGLHAAVEDVAAAPPFTADAVRAHDAALRALCAEVEAVLPVRFGSVVADEAELGRLLAPARPGLERALEAVAGREQMTVRLLRLDAAPSPDAGGHEAAASGGAGGESGTAYLERRARERSLPAAAALRAAVEALVVGERSEARTASPVLGSVFHLVRRGSGEDYRARAAAASPPPGIRYVVSGPWPAYAFGPEVL